MSLTHNEAGEWYWRNWLGLMQSPYFKTQEEAKEWKEKKHPTVNSIFGETSRKQ